MFGFTFSLNDVVSRDDHHVLERLCIDETCITGEWVMGVEGKQSQKPVGFL